MTTLLYLNDNYQTAFNSSVVEIDADSGGIVFEATLFHPQGGHQVCDTGTVSIGALELFVKEVKNSDGKVWHYIDNKDGLLEINAGDNVSGSINWDRRYKLMKTHTAQHLFSAIAKSKFGVESIDMAIEESCCMVKLGSVISASDILEIQAEMNKYFLLKLPVSKNKDGETIWVTIGDIDKRMCGCAHVRSLEEISSVCITNIIGAKVFFTVGRDAESSLKDQQLGIIEGQSHYPKDVNSILEFVKCYDNQNDEVKKKNEMIQQLSLALLSQELKDEDRKRFVNAGYYLNVMYMPELEIKQIRPLVTKFIEANSCVVIVICKNKTVLIFSSVEKISANSIMEIFKYSSADCKGGGNQKFAQGGAWNYDVDQTYQIVICAGLEVAAFCD